MSALVVCVILILVIFFVIKDYLKQRRVDKASGYIGPKSYPILGTIFEISSLDPEKAFATNRVLADRFKDTYRFWISGYHILNVLRAKDAEIVLSSPTHINKSFIYRFLYPIMGHGLLTSGGAKWTHRRKVLTPAFHFNILQQFLKIFSEESRAVANELEKVVGEETCLTPYVCPLAFNVVTETACGVKIDRDEEGDNQYRSNINKAGEFMINRLVRPWLYNDFVYRILGYEAKVNEVMAPNNAIITDIVKKRRLMFDLNKNKATDAKVMEDADETNVYQSAKRRHAMLDTLLHIEDCGEIDAAGIADEVKTFIFGGYDTTSTGLAFTLMLIAAEEGVQEKILQEVTDVLDGRSFDDLKIQDYNNMKFLERVIKEGLRLYPPAAFLSRTILEDVYAAGRFIPKDTLFHIHVFDLHRDPEQFPDPEKFDPDRFLPENIDKRHPYSFIPFSAGPRNCIGQKFAMFEMKALIGTVVQKFKLFPVTRREDIVLIADIVLRTKDPVKIKLTLRNEQ